MDILDQLRAENARLEEKLTELQERDLKATRAHRKGCESEQEKDNARIERVEGAKLDSSDSVPDDLPIVRLSPGSEHEHSEEEAFAQAPSLSAEELEDAEADSVTRPVLKVYGSQDARVYNRPLDSDERNFPSDQNAKKP